MSALVNRPLVSSCTQFLPFGLGSYASDADRVTTFSPTIYRLGHFAASDHVL